MSSPATEQSGNSVIRIKDLVKTYRTPLTRKRVEAVRGLSLDVEPGQVFGFLGPNGAGKTTTIRIMMGLITASEGSVELFGHPIPSRSARARIGFLPEAPYFYDYLTVTELCDLASRLHGVDRATRRKRNRALIDLVGLGHASSMPLKSYSKGMLQRAGIAQALVSDPELIIFDEPMGGLDPMGRKEVRDIIHHLAEQGKTIFFSSHILADVELICDHVAFIVKGKLQGSGALSDLIDAESRGTEVAVELPEEAEAAESALATLELDADKVRRAQRKLTLHLPAGVAVDAFLAEVREVGARVISVMPVHDTLEDLFLRQTGGESELIPDPETEADPEESS